MAGIMDRRQIASYLTIFTAFLACGSDVAYAQNSELPEPLQDAGVAISDSVEEFTEFATQRLTDPNVSSWSNDLRLGGWLEQGFTWNPDSPTNRFNTPVLFNDRANEYQLNQLYLFLENPVAADGTDWEVGGRVDVMLGTDFRFITVPGLEEHNDGTRRWNDGRPRFYGIAMPQMYGEVAAPYLDGVSIKFGHFYSIMGYERFAASENFFYSRSFVFTFGEPFTFSGFLTTFNLTDSVKLYGGLTTGWDNWEHPGREVGFLGGMQWTSCDEQTSATFTLHTGNDLTGATVGAAPLDEHRFNYSLVVSHQLTERLRYIFQHDYGEQHGAVINVNVPAATITFADAQWYGINQYIIYDVNDCLSAGLRFEWFSDQNLSRTLIPVEFIPGGPTFTGNDLYALTVGLNWKPRERITIRPELRWDWADIRGNPNVPGGSAAFRAFNDRQSGSQFTLGTDVILTF